MLETGECYTVALRKVREQFAARQASVQEAEEEVARIDLGTDNQVS
jgi:hypothetical protein